MALTATERLWRSVQQGPECWLWTRSVNNKGYGLMWYEGRLMLTHRIAWTITYGPIPPNMFVLHKCDTPSCCRPDHLELGDQSDNMADCSRKHRLHKSGHAAIREQRAPLRVPDAERFWTRVQKGPECWLWMGTMRERRGVMFFQHHMMFVHRISWMMTHGPIPSGLCVLHHCDVPTCVRPDHLFLGTRMDNAIDREAKGRGYRIPPHMGEAHYKAKLTDAIVTDIRAQYTPGTARALARHYGVARGTIRHIIHNRTWRHLLTK